MNYGYMNEQHSGKMYTNTNTLTHTNILEGEASSNSSIFCNI